jgi:hypothetical protein
MSPPTYKGRSETYVQVAVYYIPRVYILHTLGGPLEQQQHVPLAQQWAMKQAHKSKSAAWNLPQATALPVGLQLSHAGCLFEGNDSELL